MDRNSLNEPDSPALIAYSKDVPDVAPLRSQASITLLCVALATRPDGGGMSLTVSSNAALAWFQLLSETAVAVTVQVPAPTRVSAPVAASTVHTPLGAAE